MEAAPLHCPRRLTSGDCGCLLARLGPQRCQGCLRPIQLGSCIEHRASGWCHVLCPEAARGSIVACEFVDDGAAPLPGEHAPEPLALPGAAPRKCLSNEQQEVVHHEPRPGQRLRVSAVAGAGKTTTCVKLAERLLQADPAARILYVVFNKQAREDAMARFPKEVEIKTSHALARKRVWKEDWKVSDDSPKLDEVVEVLGLRDETEKRWHILGQLTGQSIEAEKTKTRAALQKKARIEARFVLKTLANFLWSDAPEVQDDHVFWKATLPAKSGPSRSARDVDPLPKSFYREHAQIIFNRMCDPMDADFLQNSDGYLKLFQLSGQGLGAAAAPACTALECPLRGDAMQQISGRYGKYFVCEACRSKGQSGYDVILVDEAQDFTPCQAAAFWFHAGAAVYLVGDARQRIYRWRGASEDFERVPVARQFELSETWRFGPEIAQVVNAVLDCSAGTQRVVGKNPDAGVVVWPSGSSQMLPSMGPLVIITRSNKGMFEELVQRIAKSGTGMPWAFVDSSMGHIVNPNYFRKFLASHNGETMKFRGEEFLSWEEFKEYAEDEADAKLIATIEIVEAHGDELPELIERIREKQVEDWREADLVLVTAHKAKGLEFADVCLARDFKLPVQVDEDGEHIGLMSDRELSRPRWQEELNILYVAMSRAQRRLRLSPEVARFLGFLDFRKPDIAARPPAGEEQRLDELRLGDEARWQLFEKEVAGDEGFVASVASVPWPRGPEGNVLALHDGLPEHEVKRLFQLALLRFHPDKFLARWRAHIAVPQCKTGSDLYQRLADVTRQVLALKTDWAAASEGLWNEDTCLAVINQML